MAQGSINMRVDASGVAGDLAINGDGNGATNRGRLVGFYCLWNYQERQNRKITLNEDAIWRVVFNGIQY